MSEKISLDSSALIYKIGTPNFLRTIRSFYNGFRQSRMKVIMFGLIP